MKQAHRIPKTNPFKAAAALLCTGLLIHASLPWARASAPDDITYQGRLMENDVPVEGTKNVVAKLCPSNGEPFANCVTVFSQGAHPVSNGLFSARLDIPDNLDLAGGEWWLAMSIDGNEMLPRERFSSSLFAIYASSASSLIANGGAKGVEITTSVFVLNGSSIGINTPSPNHSLDINSPAFNNQVEDIVRLRVTDDAVSYLSLQNSTIGDSSFVPSIQGMTSLANYAGLGLVARIEQADDSGSDPIMVFNAVRWDGAADQDPQNRNLYSFRNSTDNDLLNIDKSGNVGIGTSTPAERLHVAGRIRLDNYNLNGSGFLRFTDTPQAAASGLLINSVRTQSGVRGSSITVMAGDGNESGVSGSSVRGGDVHILAGYGNNSPGGDVAIRSGRMSTWAASGSSSTVTIGGVSVDGDITGATIKVHSGIAQNAAAGNTPGGPLVLRSGDGVGSGAAGDIAILPGAGSPAGRVGIGTSNPQSPLDVRGAAAFNSTMTFTAITTPNLSAGGEGVIYYDSAANKFKVSENGGAYMDMVPSGSSSGWQDTGTDVILSDVGDFVGIGTTNATQRLHVYELSSAVYSRTESDSGDAFYETSSADTFNTGLRLLENDVVSAQVRWHGGSDYLGLYVNGNDRLVANTSGNVGVGLSNPGTRLGVSGGVGIGNTYATNSIAGNNLAVQGNIGIGTTGPAENLHVYSGGTVARARVESDASGATVDADAASNNDPAFRLLEAGSMLAMTRWDGSSNYMSLYVNGSDRISIESGGNVGVGTTDPGTKLGVAGGVGIGTTYATNSIASNNLAVQGSVGIGVTGPTEALEVDGSILLKDGETRKISVEPDSASNGEALMVNAGDATAAAMSGGDLWLKSGDATTGPAGEIILHSGKSSSVGDIIFQVGDSTKVVVNNVGLGIGTTNPTIELEVDGNMMFGNSNNRTLEVANMTGASGRDLTIRAGDTSFAGATSGNLFLQSGDSTQDVGAITLQTGSGAGAAGEILMKIDTIERMRLTKERVGIGVSAPASVLDVLGDATIDTGLGLGEDPFVGYALNVHPGGGVQNTTYTAVNADLDYSGLTNPAAARLVLTHAPTAGFSGSYHGAQVTATATDADIGAAASGYGAKISLDGRGTVFGVDVMARTNTSSDGYGVYSSAYGTSASTNTGVFSEGRDSNHNYAAQFGDGLVHISSGLVQACPSGFTSITNGWKQIGCMQDDEANLGTADTWWNASDDCFTTYGGRLPTMTEWYVAMNNFALSNETDQYEWTATGSYTGSAVGMFNIGNGSLTAIQASSHATSIEYRCWIPR